MFYSILFPKREQHGEPRQTDAPACFKDLNLDQIFNPILQGKKTLELEGFFYTSLNDPGIIAYRQDIMRELEDNGIQTIFSDFSKTIYEIGQYMDTIRSSLISQDGWHNNYLTRGKMLDCAEKYCQAVFLHLEEISRLTFRSAGLRGFTKYLATYCASENYAKFSARVKQLRDGLASVSYCMLIKNRTIRVRKYEGQADHSNEILKAFGKFRQGDVGDYRHKLPEEPYAAHVESAVLNMVAGLYYDVFADLNDFCSKYLHFDDETILRFSREVQFYLSWLDFVKPLQQANLPFCYPKLCDTAEHLYDLDGFDLALAHMKYKDTVVNDFVMRAPEHIIVVTGPNQGGKTTFARAFGQVHYLASLGLCVPGREAALYLFDNILTHFGREEDLSTQNGKLQDDLVRLHELIDKATDRSIVIINEIFASTSLSDALLLGGHMMDIFAEMAVPMVLVTFLDELALHGPETISMMSTIGNDDPIRRIFKIIRKSPDGLAYAIHVASEYGLTYGQLCRRLGNEG